MEAAGRCSDLIIKNKEAIMSQWEAEVREDIMAAGLSESFALRDHLPELLDDIAQIFLEKKDQKSFLKTDKYPSTLDKNEFHGQLRAETENYTIDQVILEYFILHRIVSTFLEEHGVLTADTANLLKHILERTIMQASSAFSSAIQQMQDKLIGTLAHDIRNPLTAALSATELLREGKEFNGRLIELINKSIHRSVNLTEGLLDNIALKAGEGIMMNFTVSDLNSLIREICGDASELYVAKITCSVPEQAVTANFDRVAIRRVADNLISNAVKYGNTDEDIDLVLEHTEEEVTLKVTNQGAPIPQETQKRMFNFLHHNDESKPSRGKSWGMGLALVKLIVDAHEGSISLTSNEEHGTTFSISLKKHLKYQGKLRMKLPVHPW